MLCPYCKDAEHDTRVVDTRSLHEGQVIRRRRECPLCSFRFTTYERIEPPRLKVVKKDGRREPYQRARLLAGLRLACRKRPVSDEQLDSLVDDIEAQLRRERLETEVESRVLGEAVMDRLRALDHVAYVRFASVYREFRAADDFVTLSRDLDAAPPASRED